MKDIEKVLVSLSRSEFRQKQKLDAKEKAYLLSKGLDLITSHAIDFVTKRLAPAFPDRDGKQTPWRGHPVFVAQHATATCCRGCLAKWHAIEKGRPLSEQEIDHVVAIIRRWLESQTMGLSSCNDQ
jgi:hypothetical protein